MICKNCNYDLLPNIKDVGPHTGAYCSFCGKWIKWLGKEEKKTYAYETLYSTVHSIKHDKIVTGICEASSKLPDSIVNNLPDDIQNNLPDDFDDGEVPW